MDARKLLASYISLAILRRRNKKKKRKRAIWSRSWLKRSDRGVYRVAQLAEHWASIPKVVGSNPTVARHIFQACPVWIHTQSNITQASYSPEYITPTQQYHDY